MDDLISKEAAIKEIARWIGYIDEDMILRIQTGLKKLPSVQPEITETQVKEYCEKRCLVVLSSDAFHWLKSAQPKRKKGKWLRDPPEGGYALYKCSVCGKCWAHWWASTMTVEEMTKEVRCCPNCGADMREEKTDV